MSLKVLTFAAAVALASAACPNQCSGHGRCSQYDKCVCYRQGGLSSPYRYAYSGPDCSMRTCPMGRAYDAISTGAAALTPVVFQAANANTKPKLRAFFVPSNRTADTSANRRDQKFMVRVMTAASSSADIGTFTWKLEDDDYFEPESTIKMATSESAARHLGKLQSDGSMMASGVYVWWDQTARGSAGWTDGTNDQIAAGDVYSFSLTYNDGINYEEGDSNSAHQDVECSARGVCDYTGGKCKCFDGYTGDACQRTACPNSCSGHGACQSEARFVSDAKVGSGKYKEAYDAVQQYGCKCDVGYRGPDCSMIECPSGADPMTGEGGAEGRDCSGRGVCDYSSGTCKCFTGFYGERCDMQTNFV